MSDSYICITNIFACYLPSALLKSTQYLVNMSKLAKYRVFFTAVIVFLIVIISAGVILYARGFKPNLQTGRLDRTGLIVATSFPTGAQVFIDGRLTSATNTNIAFLEPKTYKVRIEKDGYTAWEKDIEVVADLATEINALLFPLAPEIKPLTTTGASMPTLSPDNSKIAYGVSGERGGLHILPMSDSPFAFRQNTRLIAKNTAVNDYTKAKFIWSYDSKELIARFEDETGVARANLLLDSDQNDQQPRDITASLTATLANWQQQLDQKSQTLSVLAPDEVKGATTEANIEKPSASPSATPSASPKTTATVKPVQQQTPMLNFYPHGLIFSPDEEKILYKNKDGKYKIYDIQKKREFTLPDFKDLLNISWYPDSEHLVIAEPSAISIIEADGNNKVTIYSGKFENGFVFAHPSGTRLVILTTLTQPEGTPTNLYSINLR